jgi:rhodanese-related sulfurtransferase
VTVRRLPFKELPMSGADELRVLAPEDVRAGLDRREILLVDVREPSEFAAERIHGALNFPLSTFDPKALPQAGERQVVFQCGSGKRSATAVERCRAARLKMDAHLGGGLAAWRNAGLPTIAFDPATGAVLDRR